MIADEAACSVESAGGGDRAAGSQRHLADLATFDQDDRITHFKVMVRPLKAINLLHRLMGEELMRQADKSQAASR